MEKFILERSLYAQLHLGESTYTWSGSDNLYMNSPEDWSPDSTLHTWQIYVEYYVTQMLVSLGLHSLTPYVSLPTVCDGSQEISAFASTYLGHFLLYGFQVHQ